MYAIIGVLMFFVYNVALFVAFETKIARGGRGAEEVVDKHIESVYIDTIRKGNIMTDWMKVSKATFNQMAKNFSAEWVTHGFTVDGVFSGSMEIVDQDEDCYWFDYYVTEELYQRYEAECV
jgi:hypothetical protein